MPKSLLLRCSLLALLAVPANAQQADVAPLAARDLHLGIVIPRVSCTSKPEQSYALYLPSRYSPEKRWPVVFAFDPGARGAVPVELMKDAAERYGFIVVGSNNSSNGPWKPEVEAAQAMFQDTHARLVVDDNRVYFAGFSGGARVAASLAQGCKCVAGVFLNGAGFSPGSSPSPNAPFAVFAAVGTYDFNYGELVDLDAKLTSLHYPHLLRRFDGLHQWAPANVMQEALAWFRLMAMKDGREPRDDAFVTAQAAQEEQRASAAERDASPFHSWKEYRQAVDTFDGLSDTTLFRERAATLEKEKAVHDGAKRERQEFKEQDRLTVDISTGLAALREPIVNHAEILSQLNQQISSLRSRTEHEKRTEKVRVFRRAIAGILVQAMESGGERLEAKDAIHARDYFVLAVAADPDSVWALGNLAAAKALDGDRKGALETLRQAKEKTEDPAAFSTWLKDEPAFAKIRDALEFRALLLDR